MREVPPKLNPLALRFLIAGSVIVVGGVAIAVTGAAVGEGAVWKGALVVLAGIGLIASGLSRNTNASPPTP